MPLDWLNTPLDADIGDLIARKKRAKTIELLRSQLQGRMVPPVQLRIQLADLLVQAGREAEAVPVLIGLADEFAGDGFVAKAVAILKRVDRIQPGREDVESRLGRLVKQQRAAPAAAPSIRQVPEFGIEEIREDDADLAEAAASVDPGQAAADAAPPHAAPAATPPPPTETEASRRVRGVFRRFLASLPGAGRSSVEAPPARSAPPSIEPVTAGDETVPDDAPPAAADEAVAEAVPDTVPDAAPEADTAPDATPETDTAPDATPDADSAETIDASHAIVPEPEAIETVAAAPIEPAPTESPAVPAAEDEPSAARDAAVPPDAGAATDAAPPAAVEPPAASAGMPQPHGVTQKIKGAFRWLVASLASPAEAPAAAAEEASAPAPGTAGESAAPLDPVGTVESAVASPDAATAPPTAPPETRDVADAAADEEPMSDEVFEERLLDLVEDILHRPGSGKAPDDAPLERRLVLRYAQRLLATALFGALTEEELLAVVRGLRLHLHGPGDVLVTEGERGQSVFILASGAVKVFVRSPSGRNFAVAELREGEFFGEISSLSGRPRSATVTASSRCELLELDRPTLDQIARTHPHVADVLEEFYIRRASSPEAAAVRAVPLDDAGMERKAIEVLEAHFGQSRWDPRMRLRLADVLLKAGKYQDAVPVLIGLADELARAGFPEKAIAVLKKIEQIQRRNIEVVNLAPLARGGQPPVAAAAPAPGREGAAAKPASRPQATAEFFEGWLVDVLRDRVAAHKGDDLGREEAERAALVSIRGYGPGLLASPLFEDFTDEELLAVIRGLRLLTFEPGDVIITEGEPGQSLFVLATGTVKVFVRDAGGHNVALCPLGEGAFFGEIATLSGRPRSATVTAASRCELLELDKPALETILEVHPRVRTVLEEHYIARANDPEAAAIRGAGQVRPGPDGPG
jgi:CRP-like cAMP-binding protein